MKKFNKKTMSIHGEEYDELLQKEIDVWSNYREGEDSVINFHELKKTHAYLTYRKGTVEVELDYIKNCGPDISVLELGSADGWLSNEILDLENVKSVTSIDISLEKNREKYNEKSYAIRGDLNKIEKIEFHEQYDCIITHGTLHHLVDPRKTLLFCINSLLKKNGLIIINDTWTLRWPQLSVNAFFYAFFNQLPHAILRLDIQEIGKLLFYKLPRIIIDKHYAASIAHAHHVSPFESISSADDYKDLYKRDDMKILHFENLAALPGLQNSWMSSPVFVKKIIQTLDTFLLKTKILSGDYHVCVLKKIH